LRVYNDRYTDHDAENSRRLLPTGVYLEAF
jgi:hypothetical protein